MKVKKGELRLKYIDAVKGADQNDAVFIESCREQIQVEWMDYLSTLHKADESAVPAWYIPPLNKYQKAILLTLPPPTKPAQPGDWHVNDRFPGDEAQTVAGRTAESILGVIYDKWQQVSCKTLNPKKPGEVNGARL